MDTTRILEAKMDSAARDYDDAIADGTVTPEDMRDIVDANLLRFLSQWALQTKQQSDFELAKASLQGIK